MPTEAAEASGCGGVSEAVASMPAESCMHVCKISLFLNVSSLCLSYAFLLMKRLSKSGRSDWVLNLKGWVSRSSVPSPERLHIFLGS